MASNLTKDEKLRIVGELRGVGAHAVDTSHLMMQTDTTTIDPGVMQLTWGATALVLHMLGESMQEVCKLVEEEIANADG